MDDMGSEVHHRNDLIATKAQLELVIREARIGVWDWDLETNTSYLSAEWKRQLGYEEHEIANRHDEWESRLHPDDRQRVMRATEDSLSDPNTFYRIEFRLRHRDGSYRWIRSSGIVLRRDDGTPYRKVGCHVDITDLKQSEQTAQLESVERMRAEEKLRDQTVQLAHVARLSSMGEVVAGIAHEVNQPLQAISSLAATCRHLLNDANTPTDEANAIIHEISTQAIRCGNIIKSLREFVRKSDSKRIPVNLNELIVESVPLAAVAMKNRETNVQFNLSRDIPSVVVDRTQIQQVLVNLLRNAFEATEAPDNHSPITISSSIECDAVQIDVKDHGEGLSNEVSERLFEAFTTTKDDGMGLGLAISRSIVESHNGKIWASTPTRGTTFHVKLPITANSNSLTNRDSTGATTQVHRL